MAPTIIESDSMTEAYGQWVSEAAAEIVNSTCSSELVAEEPEDFSDEGGLIGIIPLEGDVTWSIFLALPIETATTLMEKLADSEAPTESGEIGEAVEKLTNAFAGNVKIKLDSKGINCDIPGPTVLRTKALKILNQANSSVTKKCFSSPTGKLWAGIVEGCEPSDQQNDESPLADEEPQHYVAEQPQSPELAELNKQLHDQISEHQQAQDELVGNCDRLEQRVAELTSELALTNERSDAELAAHMQVGERIEQQTAELAAANEQLQSRVHEREQAAKLLEQQSDELAAADKELQDHIAERHREQNNLQESRDQLELRVEELDGELATAQEAVRQKVAEQQEAEQRITQQSFELAELKKQLQDQISEHQQAQEELRGNCNRLEQRVAELTTQLAVANERLEAELAEHMQAGNRLKQQTAELAAANERLQSRVHEREQAAKLLDQQSSDLAATGNEPHDHLATQQHKQNNSQASRDRLEHRVEELDGALKTAKDAVRRKVAEHRRATHNLRMLKMKLDLFLAGSR